MEKRITAITLNNYKGYFGRYEPILFPNGENVLIYGENGSGKSSLYKALNIFFLSSRNASIQFEKNKYNEEESGEISIEFSDYDRTVRKVIEKSNTAYSFSDKAMNHKIPLIQNAALVKGFLDYTDLLKIYLHEDPHPNLFNLIVLTIIGEHIPISSGGNFRFRDKWEQLQNDLIHNPRTRNDRKHRNAYTFLPFFETHLRTTLNEVVDKMNSFLKTYFSDFDIELKYDLKPITFNYPNGNKCSWCTTADLRLIVEKNGLDFTYGYGNYLNEARLSAIAVCMYLASLKVTNKNLDLKIIYLDDVFIGLDSSNRIPILNILRIEFSDYQKFISTYDRHWFELAKRQFQIYNVESWKYIEMYVGQDIAPGGNRINKPIVNKGCSNAEKGTMYLHHSSNPDYPAAANYYRKAVEELISIHVPKYELASKDYSQIPEYKLGILLDKCRKALEKINSDTSNISVIQGHLYSLLHPLSHHEISSFIYKRELESIEYSFYKLEEQLKSINFKNNYKCVQETGSKLRVHFTINSSINHIQNYELILMESLLSFTKSDGSLAITKSACYMCKREGLKNDGFRNGQKSFIQFLKKNNPDTTYPSLMDAVSTIYLYITTEEGYSFPKPSNPLDVIEVFDGKEWLPIKTQLL